MEFDEEFSGTPVEGTGEEALIQSVPISKGPKPKREKKEPGEDLFERFFHVKIYIFRVLLDSFDCVFFE